MTIDNAIALGFLFGYGLAAGISAFALSVVALGWFLCWWFRPREQKR
jgi:hypothetical protein